MATQLAGEQIWDKTVTDLDVNFSGAASRFPATLESTDVVYISTAAAPTGIVKTTIGAILAAFSAWASQTANKIFASPNGSAGTPGFRQMVESDLPSTVVVNDGVTPGVKKIVVCSQATYNALNPKISTTLYIITS